MATNEIKLKTIAEELTKQLNLCEETLKYTSHSLGLLDNSSDTYNEAWYGFAATSIMNHQFQVLKNFVDAGDVKMTENCIRFTLHQLEKFTNHEDLIKDNSTGDILLDAKITIYQNFKAYLKHFED